MKCPMDDSPLSVSSREGVEIDFCPQCRGVWLDRGELDKIIDRAATQLVPAAAPPPVRSQPHLDDRVGEPERRREPYPYKDNDDGIDRSGRRKKRSFLDDLFDFD